MKPLKQKLLELAQCKQVHKILNQTLKSYLIMSIVTTRGTNNRRSIRTNKVLNNSLTQAIMQYNFIPLEVRSDVVVIYKLTIFYKIYVS